MAMISDERLTELWHTLPIQRTFDLTIRAYARVVAAEARKECEAERDALRALLLQVRHHGPLPRGLEDAIDAALTGKDGSCNRCGGIGCPSCDARCLATDNAKFAGRTL